MKTNKVEKHVYKKNDIIIEYLLDASKNSNQTKYKYTICIEDILLTDGYEKESIFYKMSENDTLDYVCMLMKHHESQNINI